MDKYIEKWAKIQPRQRYLIIAGVGVAIIFGYWYLFHTEVSSKLARVEKEYRTMESERAEKQAYVDNLAKYEARLNELQQDLNVARAQLPDNADVAQLLAQLGNKGRQSGLVIDQFKPGGETERDYVAEIAFAIEVAGSFHEIATFIDAIGSMDRIVNVTNITMTNPKEENQKAVVKGTFDIKTYRFVAVSKKPASQPDKKKKK